MLLKARACPDRHFVCLKENGQSCKIDEYEVLEKTKMIIVISLALICLLKTSLVSEITTYFLNSEFDYKATQDPSDPNIECLHTNEDFILPRKVTICHRAYGMMYQNSQNPWISVLGLGVINPSFTAIEEGIMFGVWETGPWLGIKYRASESYSWIGLGDDFLPQAQI